MRIDTVYIEDFKNLKQFEIDFDEKELNTILLGQNAVGKSNFIEALILIFRELDFEKATDFDYKIKYECRGKNIEIECIKKKYQFKIDSESITKTAFDRNKNEYLPKNIFTYYSGLSDRMDKLFWKHQNNFYKKIIKPNFDSSKIDELRRLFYVKQIHSFFVLLAFYSLNETEQETKSFLQKYFGIEDIDSILFVIKRPSWYIEAKHNESKFFGANGLVNEFLTALWDYSLAPIYHTETVYPDFRSKGITEHQLYLYLSNKDKLKEFANKYFVKSNEQPSNSFLFKAMESTYISELLSEVKVKVKKRIDGKITFKELSEGEQQLLTVIGLLIFNREEESLILLDEPETHLNPLWKWEYLDIIKKVFEKNSNSEEDKKETTQILINTHDPLVIGGLKKEHIRIFKNDNLNKIITEEPEKDPKGMGVAGILTSELFGLPTILDKDTQDLLDERNELLYKQSISELSSEEKDRLKNLFEFLNNLGFSHIINDPLYTKFIIAYQKLNSEKNITTQSVARKTWDSSNEAYNLLKNLISKNK